MSLDLLSLTNVLEQANSSERNVNQKLAENQLKEWEKQPGFHYLLQSVYNDLSLPLQTRWLAIISFKNGVEKYWRSSRVSAIPPEEKQQIKQRLFEMIDEPNKQLAVQNAQAISRVCRFDFPQEWPTLFDDIERILQQAVQEKNNVKIHNMLIILNQVIKNLAMAKIGRTRPALQSKAPIITPILIKLYESFFNEWIHSIDFGMMEIGYQCLKVMRRLITEVYDSPYQSQHIIEFMKTSTHHFQLLTQNYDKYAPSDILEKYIKCYSKIYYLLCRSNTTNFILFPCSKEMLFTLLKLLQDKAEVVYNNEGDGSGDVWEFLSIKTLLIFKALINFLFKRGAVLTLKSKSNKIEVENAINILSTQFFSHDLIISLTDLLIAYYIKLKPSDLESWTSEPEEWVNDEVNQNYEYQIRQCAENFFQDLMINFQDLLVPYVLGKVQNEMVNYEEVSVQNIFLKDSVFSIFELSAGSIAEQVEFNDLCERIFFPEALKNDLSENRILKRRVSLLINEWCGLSIFTPELFQKIYALLLEFLNPQNPINDKVVMLTAIQALKTLITDWDFNKELFAPFIKPFTTHLLRLTSQMELTESKLFLLNTISDLIYRTNPLISEAELDQLLAIVPAFWDNSNDSNELILKNSLLRILKNLIMSLNQNSHITWEIALPLISVCCSPTSEYHTLLSEDGYELWLSILQFYPANQSLEMNSSIIKDFTNFYFDALMNQTEILPLILEILRSYAILIPKLFVMDESRGFIIKIFGILAKYLPHMRDDALDVLISYLEILLLENYLDLSNFQKLLSIMMESRLLPAIIEIIMDDEQSQITVGKLLLVIARISYLEPQDLIQVFHYLYQSENELRGAVFKFMIIWYARMDANISNPRNRKIHVLGLTSLLRTGEQVFLEDLKPLVGLWINALEEIHESSNNGDCEKYHSNYLYEFRYNEDFTIQENGEYLRFQELFKVADPVHNLVLKDYVKDTLTIVKMKIGDDNLNQLIAGLDKNLVDNFQYFMNLPTN
jgi:hypothetical protein